VAGLPPGALQVLARLEGKTLPRGQALADVLGISPGAAWEVIRDLRRRGVLGLVSRVSDGQTPCECVTYLKVDWTQLTDLPAFDDWLARDPEILVAVRIAGQYDYRLRSGHRDFRRANDWSRDLQADPRVSKVWTRFCTTVFDRPNYAAAILGSDRNAAEPFPCRRVFHVAQS
jgi:hypothetical protein